MTRTDLLELFFELDKFLVPVDLKTLNSLYQFLDLVFFLEQLVVQGLYLGLILLDDQTLLVSRTCALILRPVDHQVRQVLIFLSENLVQTCYLLFHLTLLLQVLALINLELLYLALKAGLLQHKLRDNIPQLNLDSLFHIIFPLNL